MIELLFESKQEIEESVVLPSGSKAARKCSAQIQEIERSAISSMLDQLMPVRGGLANIQLSSSASTEAA